MINKSSQESHRASKKILKFFPKGFVHSITYDNGTQNAMHFKINKEFGTFSFFCGHIVLGKKERLKIQMN
ncbi:MAG: hypothetical protein LBC07_03645 [Elusimicrobiota bacterium]|nr:hypothetical protein [Elusimicrobiota bacterium]